MPVTLITGSACGIGHAIALRLARDGFDIALNDIPSKTPELEALAHQIRSTGRKACLVLADVALEAEVKGMVAKAVEKLGGLDVVRACLLESLHVRLIGSTLCTLVEQMVANAGVVVPNTVVDSSLRFLHLEFYFNLLTTIRLLYYSAARMEDAEKIINVNFKGVFLCYKYAGKQMIEQGRGGR
jgi:NAD(P)-dependent dehydrogenase (short-subunit alcohol dehydrogenase family)